MKLKNTSIFSDEKVKEIIDFVKPNNLPTTKIDVIVKNGNGSGKFVPAYDHYIHYLHKSRTTYAEPIYTSDDKRDKIITSVNHKLEDNKYPFIRHQPSKRVTLYWDRYNEKTGKWEEGWHSTGYISVSNKFLQNHKDFRANNSKYLPCLVLNKTEDFVETIAHEYRHFWQLSHWKKRNKVWGAKGHFSETDACAYAIRKVREWRRLHAVDIYPKQPDMIPMLREVIQ